MAPTIWNDASLYYSKMRGAGLDLSASIVSAAANKSEH